MEFRNITSGNEPGLMLFDPRDYVPNWPVTNFSDYKSSIIGRYSRAIHVAAYDVATDSGFRMIAVPNIHRGIDTQPYDPSELLVRSAYHKPFDNSYCALELHLVTNVTSLSFPRFIYYYYINSLM